MCTHFITDLNPADTTHFLKCVAGKPFTVHPTGKIFFLPKKVQKNLFNLAQEEEEETKRTRKIYKKILSNKSYERN